MGTPEFAAIVLRRLLAWKGGNILGVYTGPDKKSGRGMNLAMSAVKHVALEHDLPIFQPASLRPAQEQETLRSLRPDFLVVAAYGLILPQAVLDCAAIAPVNVHASLLPRYRGAAPIQRAIMENCGPDAETGVSIMKMVGKLDAGPVFMEKKVPIAGKYCEDLSRDLAERGGEALVETLEKLAAGNIQPVEQDEALATYAHKLEKADGNLDWRKKACQIEAQIRAVTPWPGARTEIMFENGGVIPVAILAGRAGEPVNGAVCGQIFRHRDGLAIACADRWFHLEKLKPRGRGEMKAGDFANGHCKIKYGPCGRALTGA